MPKKKPDMINDVGDEPTPVKASGKISPKEVYERLVEPLGKPKMYEAPGPTLPPAPIPGLKGLEWVHYVLTPDKHRLGMVHQVIDEPNGILSMTVFFDGENDGRSRHNNTEWFPTVEYSEFHVVGTWHFIEKA
jgi:hypothetical protein